MSLFNEAFSPRDVDSSHLSTIEYTDRLYVTFTNGAIYEYLGVPEDLAFKMTQAPSKGKFFWRFIRNQYSYRRIKEIPKLATVPVGYKFKAPDNDTYVWRGAQWVNTRTGRIATRQVRELISEIVLKIERYRRNGA